MRKRSDTSSSQPSPVYFVDRCLGRRDVPDAIRNAGLTVELMDDHFDQKARDEVWIPDVASRGWVIVTKDYRILRRPMEQAALMRSGATYVGIAAKGKTGPQMAAALGSQIARLNATFLAARRPLWFRVLTGGPQIAIDGNWVPLRKKHENPKTWRRAKSR